MKGDKMQTLSVQAKITKKIITSQDRHNLCMHIIKEIMFPTQTIEAPYVPQITQQRQSQASTAVTTLQRSGFLAQQKALVQAYAQPMEKGDTE
jgi:hypothetical protein